MFRTVAVTAATPIFQAPAPNQTPLRVAEPGFMLTFISHDGTWHRVMFEDPNVGRVYGYVAVKSATVPSSNKPVPEPLDLTIRELKLAQPEPLDAFVPIDLSVDLSVPRAK